MTASVFEQSGLFLDNPHGGVENLSDMKAAGFSWVMCNVKDYPPAEWEQVVLPRAKSLGMFCGPWGRTQEPGGGFSYTILALLKDTATKWDSPMVVNSEKEIDGSGATYTISIAAACAGKDAALISEPWLFSSVNWTPVSGIPMLLEIFPGEAPAAKDPQGCRKHAHDLGLQCVYFTFGTYGTQKPSDYDLKAPYSLYTADACGGNYLPWKPTSVGFQACEEASMPLDPTTKLAVRREMEHFCLLAEQYQLRWHYTQARPFSGLGAAPQTYHHDDCSAYASLIFYWAGHHVLHGSMNDPLNQHYSGYGNTQTAYEYLKPHPVPVPGDSVQYRRGDMAIYGSAADTKHMSICRKAGTSSSALFSSFGSESGPQPEALHYRSDLVGVYRHPALL